MTNHPRRRTLTRRAALQGATAFASLALLPPLAHAQSGQAAAAAKPAAKGTRLVLLGTRGGPGVTPDRSQTASALLVDGVPVYFLTELIVINIVMVLVTLHQERLSAGLTAMVEARP